jgi:hypothetical protein
MKSFSIFIFFCLLSSVSFSQDFTIRGFIYNTEGEPMSFEKVKLLGLDSSVVGGAITKVNGFYSISKLEKGSYILKVESSGFIVQTESVTVNEAKGILDKDFNLKKRQDVQDMEEMNASASAKTKRIIISEITLDKKALERVPSMGAENDIIGAISITPGVITTGDQGGQLYVRGGTPIQNKILLDGMTIYSPFHSIGFFSIFETELVQSTSIYTGGFDAEYGGRISSIMDITYRDGNRKKFGGKVSASPFMGKLVLEGPFSKPKTDEKTGEQKLSSGSYIFSAKHSLLNYTSKSLYPRINDGDGMPFSFTDVYGKITFKGNTGSKFSGFGFHNRDAVNYDIADINWTQSGGGINFLLVPSSSPIFVRGHVNGSSYSTQFDETISETDTLSRFSSIGGFDLGFDFTYFLKNESELTFGINLGGFNTKFETFNEAKRKIEANNFTTEIGVYLSYKFLSTRWVVQPSFRTQVYASLGEISPEPRLRIQFNANEWLRIKASGGRFSQNFTSASSDKDVVNLFNGLLSAPTNVQETFVTMFQNERSPENGLQIAWHAIAGFEVDLSKEFSINVEGYYKYFSQLSNINQNKLYPDTDEFSQIDDVYKKDFILENGESYGADVLLKYSGNRLFLWGVYSYGYSHRWDGDTLYFPVFDRRHNINLVGTYLFGKKKGLEVSIRWNLGSGLPFTPTAGFYELEDFNGSVTTDPTTSNQNDVSTILGEFNSERLPYYHRLDLTVKKQFKFKNESVIEAIASVTNVYNRKNIFYVNRITNEKIYQFPILPSLGLSYKF